MTNIKKLNDKDLAKMARSVEAERQLRANRARAAKAIEATLKKYKLGASELSQLGIGKSPRRGRPVTLAGRKKKATSKAGKRSKVASKYKNPNGPEKWAGRGRAPLWVTAILRQRNITLVQFKNDKRYQI